MPGETLPETQLAFPTRSTHSMPPPVDWTPPRTQAAATKGELEKMGGEGLSLRAVSGGAATRRPPRMRGGAAATADAAAAEVRGFESRVQSSAGSRVGNVGKEETFV